MRSLGLGLAFFVLLTLIMLAAYNCGMRNSGHPELVVGLGGKYGLVGTDRNLSR